MSNEATNNEATNNGYTDAEKEDYRLLWDAQKALRDLPDGESVYDHAHKLNHFLGNRWFNGDGPHGYDAFWALQDSKESDGFRKVMRKAIFAGMAEETRTFLLGLPDASLMLVKNLVWASFKVVTDIHKSPICWNIEVTLPASRVGPGESRRFVEVLHERRPPREEESSDDEEEESSDDKEEEAAHSQSLGGC